MDWLARQGCDMYSVLGPLLRELNTTALRSPQ